MARIDTTIVPATGEGWNLYEVREATETTSRGGDLMFEVVLRGVHDRSLELKDWIMLAGRGWGMGLDKLYALGVPQGFQGELYPDQIEGKRVWVAGTLDYTDKKTGEKKTGRRANVDATKGKSGYLPENQPPPGVEIPADTPSDEDTPF